MNVRSLANQTLVSTLIGVCFFSALSVLRPVTLTWHPDLDRWVVDRVVVSHKRPVTRVEPSFSFVQSGHLLGDPIRTLVLGSVALPTTRKQRECALREPEDQLCLTQHSRLPEVFRHIADPAFERIPSIFFVSVRRCTLSVSYTNCLYARREGGRLLTWWPLSSLSSSRTLMAVMTVDPVPRLRLSHVRTNDRVGSSFPLPAFL